MVDVSRTEAIGKAVAENGRVLATLDDWRAMGFLAVIVFLVQAATIIYLLFSSKAERQAQHEQMNAERKEAAEERSRLLAENAEERDKMRSVAEKFGDAAEKVGDTHNKLIVELQVLRAVASRVESRADGLPG